MIRKLGVLLVGSAFLMSGALVGVSYGGGGGIPEAEVIELHIDVCSRPHFFFFDDPDGPESAIVGQVTLCRSPIFDADGNRVGKQNVSCVVSDKTDWLCTNVYTLKEGPFTDGGTIVTTGHYDGGEGDVHAITGGSGAYQDVGGYAVQEGGPGINHTLNLIP
ncbi:MAG TPA: hypothetical protein VIC58_03850 [Actinomycetota bacterium]